MNVTCNKHKQTALDYSTVQDTDDERLVHGLRAGGARRLRLLVQPAAGLHHILRLVVQIVRSDEHSPLRRPTVADPRRSGSAARQKGAQRLKPNQPLHLHSLISYLQVVLRHCKLTVPVFVYSSRCYSSTNVGPGIGSEALT